MLCCFALFVCLTLLASFFLPSSSLINMYMYMYIHIICTHMHTADFALRLVDGTHTYNGRVEVYHSDEWGTICDDSFGFEEAVVICHELGYPGAEDWHRYTCMCTVLYSKPCYAVISLYNSVISLYNSVNSLYNSVNFAQVSKLSVNTYTIILPVLYSRVCLSAFPPSLAQCGPLWSRRWTDMDGRSSLQRL